MTDMRISGSERERKVIIISEKTCSKHREKQNYELFNGFKYNTNNTVKSVHIIFLCLSLF